MTVGGEEVGEARREAEEGVTDHAILRNVE
jgi:hypothetical protein